MRKERGFSQIAPSPEMLEGREMEKFFKSERNYIILTNSGKPVFST